jgi:hypothetical protein|nr:MAG TPA: hypothetical protein [Caudoviricetes sp.]
MNSRLTGKIRNVDGSASSIKPIADDKGFPNKFGSDVLTKLADYEDLEEQGRLLKLPCKVGDTVYYISEGFVEPCTIEVIFLADYTDKNGNCSYMAEIHYDREDCPYVSTEIYFTDIGKTVFLAKSEAEAKLKKLKGE